jgi:predicted nucleotidyltransferase
MKSTLLDISGKLDAEVVYAFSCISEAAAKEGIDFVVVGATARDYLLELGCGVRISRATYDVDVAVHVSSWEEYERLTTELQGRARFSRAKTAPHRLLTPGGLTIDLIPFGPIAGAVEEIAWPPQGDWILNVQGFEAALTHSVQVLIQKDPPLIVRVASLPSLAVMKLISWNSNPARGKDAFDLYVIMHHYMDTPIIERLSGDAADLVLEPVAPLEEIGVQMLGRDMAAICSRGTREMLAEILRREQFDADTNPLAAALTSAAGASTALDSMLHLLRLLKRGFDEAMIRKA